MVNLPAAHLFNSEDEMAVFASNINTIVFGKVKVKYEMLGLLGGRCVGLFYIQRNNESQLIHDEFIKLIENEEMSQTYIEKEEPHFLKDNEYELVHELCSDCEALTMLHQKGQDHCVCGEDWVGNQCVYWKNEK